MKLGKPDITGFRSFADKTGVEFSSAEKFRIRLRMEKYLNKKLDIVIRKFADPIILHRAEKDLKYVTKYQK